MHAARVSAQRAVVSRKRARALVRAFFSRSVRIAVAGDDVDAAPAASDISATSPPPRHAFAALYRPQYLLT